MSGAHMLTIVIPVHNRRNLVEHTLGSLRQQTAPRFATVLVDNASTDGSIEVLRKWQAENNSPERPVTVLSESTPGASAARNRGLDAVESPWVLFFDSDDLMHPGHIERVLRPTYSAGIQFTGISQESAPYTVSTPTTPIGTRSSTAATPHNDGAPAPTL